MRVGLLSVLALGVLAAFGARAAEREFYSGYTGSVPPTAEDQAKTYFDRPEVRRLLARLESGTLPDTVASTMLGQTQLSDLERLRLVRDDKGVLRIAFPYFTAADMDLIHGVAAKYVPSLVAAYESHQAQFDIIFARYPMAGVSRKRLAFVLLAGFSLNWDALDLLSEKNYRQPLLIVGNGWHYGFWASEAVPGYSYKGYYWGSTSFPIDTMNLDPPLDFTFSSFGDPFSDPRMSFPDLLAMPVDQMTPGLRTAATTLGLHDDSELGMNLKNVVGLDRARSLGAILFAARAGADTKAKLCAALAASDADGCDGELGLLAACGYLKASEGDHYALAVPVFDADDKPTLDATLALSRSVISGWLAQNHMPMRRELVHLTAVRQGVPYTAMFTQIWHEIFGLATREMASEGMIEDAYAPDVVWQGSIPAVWRSGIYHHAWQ